MGTHILPSIVCHLMYSKILLLLSGHYFQKYYLAFIGKSSSFTESSKSWHIIYISCHHTTSHTGYQPDGAAAIPSHRLYRLFSCLHGQVQNSHTSPQSSPAGWTILTTIAGLLH